MTNPGPRPALRKAPDADLHPAEADKSRQAVVIDLAERSIGLPDAPRTSSNRAHPSLAPSRPGRSTSAPRPAEHDADDVPVSDDQAGDDRAGDDKAGRSGKADKNRKARKKKARAHTKADKKTRRAAKNAAKRLNGKGTKKPKGMQPKKAKTDKAADLAGETILDPRIALKSSVSRKARRDMRAGAKARGTSLDATVDSVVTDLRNR